MIRTVTGDRAAVAGRILAHEHLQIDLSVQKGPANRIGAAEEDAVVDDLVDAKAFGLAVITDLSAPSSDAIRPRCGGSASALASR